MAECGWFPSPLLVVKYLELYRLRLNLYIVFDYDVYMLFSMLA